MTKGEIENSHGHPPHHFPAGSRSALSRLHETMTVWHERTLQRRELLGMPEHLLKDIGITREDTYREIRKRFWQA